MSMYIIVPPGKELEYMHQETLMHIAGKIKSEIKKHPGPKVVGGLMLEGTTLRDGRVMSVWIEFLAEFKPVKPNLTSYPGLTQVQFDIVACIIFDECPDIVLDRISHLKEVLNM